MSSFVHPTSEADSPPFGLVDTICDVTVSPAFLTALRHHEVQRTTGQVGDPNILEPIMTAVRPSPIRWRLGQVEHRHVSRSTNNVPRNTSTKSYDSWKAVSTSAHAMAERVMPWVGHPEVIDAGRLATGRRDLDHVDELDHRVGDWLAQRVRAGVLGACNETAAAIAPVYNTADPHVRDTQMLTTVDDPDLGEVLMHNVLWRMSATPGHIRHTGRNLGADTDEVLTELDYAADNLARLRAAGAIA